MCLPAPTARGAAHHALCSGTLWPHSPTVRLHLPPGQASEDVCVCSGTRTSGRGGGGGVPLRQWWLLWAPVPICTDWHFSERLITVYAVAPAL